MMGVTAELAKFVCHTRYEDIPEEAISIAKRCIIDGIGIMLSGSTEEAIRILLDYLLPLKGKKEATVLGKKIRLPAPQAALVNGTSGHAQDFDDTQLSTTPDRIYGLLTHPTVPVLAGVLAVGERRNISGKEFLTAFVVGSEVECKIAEAIDPTHYKKGYHTTGTIGTFGSAAAAAKILGLTEEQTCTTIGIAASMSAGIRANFGTMTKPLHAGRAAENGIVAASLARLGFTAAKDALENPWGYFAILGNGFDEARLLNKLGNPYTLVYPGISIKPYPSGVLSHPSMDAMLDLVREFDLKPQDIKEVKLYAGSNILNPLRYNLPQTALEGKFSLPFCLASIILRRKAGLKEFSDEFIRSREVQDLMKRILTIHDPEIETQGYDRIRSRIEVLLHDGRILIKNSGPYRGGPERPLSEEELAEKFLSCAEFVLKPTSARALLNILGEIDKVPHIRKVIAKTKP